MNNHILNNTAFTIRTRDEILFVGYGIKPAVDFINTLTNKASTGVFFDGQEMTANFFTAWGNRMNNLLNKVGA